MISSYINTFYSKLAIAVLACFVGIGLLLLMLAHHTSRQYQQEIEQKLHKDLAKHLVHDHQLFNQGNLNPTAIKQAFHAMMILGPSFEFYILNPSGKVLTYSAEKDKIKRQHISLNSIQTFISGNPHYPLVGDDPRSTDQKKIFSVAPIFEGDQLSGYLYIIIGGEIYDNVATMLRQSHILSLGGWAVFVTLLFSLLLVLVIFSFLTRPLKQLSKDISILQKQGFKQGCQLTSCWNAASSDEIQQLGSGFHAMIDTLNQHYQKVQSTEQLRRELISYISHDLRTPLSALQGYLETWQLQHQKIALEASEQLIQVALDNACTTSQLVEQLFELAHLDSITVLLHQEPVALPELVHDVMQKLRLQADQRQVNLAVWPEDPSLVAHADIQRIERVFTNLIENAIRHCNAGDKVSVEISEHSQQERLQIKVKDTGRGIAPEDLSRIFEPHFRASNSVAGNRIHSGLGLAITQRILQLHNSSIEVISILDKGTEFTFQLSRAS